MRQLYVCSHTLDNDFDNVARRRLIGVLREITPGTSPENQGQYEFQYLIGGKFHEFCLQLPYLPDPNKIYNNNEISRIMRSWLPEPNDIWLDGLLKTAGLSEYDEWEWLKYFGQHKQHQHYAFLFETLPGGVICYVQL